MGRQHPECGPQRYPSVLGSQDPRGRAALPCRLLPLGGARGHLVVQLCLVPRNTFILWLPFTVPGSVWALSSLPAGVRQGPFIGESACRRSLHVDTVQG